MNMDVLNMFNYQINCNNTLVGMIHSYYENILSDDFKKNKIILKRFSLGNTITKVEVETDGNNESE